MPSLNPRLFKIISFVFNGPLLYSPFIAPYTVLM